MRDWSNDLILRALQSLEEPVGSLIQAFPGRNGLANEPDWLDGWFLELTKKFAAGNAPDPKQIVSSAAGSGDLSLLSRMPVECRVRLVSIKPIHFRGFRGEAKAIALNADLMVVEGRNSSGKTSLSEAIEWVLTGKLSRRTSGQYGHARELADCIANEFKPDDGHTSVELGLSVDDVPLLLKRILKRDYSTTASDEPESEFYVDNQLCTKAREAALMERIFAGVHPILMQHNLRRFVHDDPTSRRQYFERLLQIDELTALIEKAVVGPATLKQISNPAGGTGLAALRALITEIGDGKASSGLKKVERSAPSEVVEFLGTALVTSARQLFEGLITPTATLGQCRDGLAEAQRTQRASRLPLLAALEKPRTQASPSTAPLERELAAVREAMAHHETARKAAATVSEAQQHLARVTQTLIDAQLIDTRQAHSQTCPVCNDSADTLTPERVRELTSWNPLTMAVDVAAGELRNKRDRMSRELAQLVASAKAVVPVLPSDEEIDRQVAAASQRVQELSRSALASGRMVGVRIQQVLAEAKSLEECVAMQTPQPLALDGVIDALRLAVAAVQPALLTHREDVAHLEEAVGAASRDDATYRLREKWLDVASLVTAVADDVAWEHAKTAAKGCFDGLREGLIALRGEIIEQARETFSARITEVWHLLRNDTGARFSELAIPEARGKGYKLEFELKAVISDGETASQVDALRVFSESQVNVIGLAAYVTRAGLLGHRLLIFDDPVQSMDEEHFRSFAGKLLPMLLDTGFQILILTHSDTFARKVNDHHFDRLSYASLEARASKRLGCQVLEGNRRVGERLKNADRIAGEGDLQNAWRLVRVAVERLYTLAYTRAIPGFEAEKWRGLTAEDMWNKGVSEVIEKAVPGSGKRLKEILTSTVAGAHDVAATSETDLRDATKFVRGLLSPLRLGDG